MSLHNYGQSADREEQPLLKSEINTFTELSHPQVTGRVRDRKGDGIPPTVVVVLIFCSAKKKNAPGYILAD